MLFLDIGLPDMDGYELAGRSRTMPETEEACWSQSLGMGNGRIKRGQEPQDSIIIW